MKQIIAMHGWYSDSSYWDNLGRYFKSNGWIWQNPERGYGYIESSEPSWDLNDKECTNQQEKKLIICHSLGLHLIPNPIIDKASHIILINSFSRFIPFGRERRAITIALEGMKKQIGSNTESKMLLKFAKKANKFNVNKVPNTSNFNSGISIEGRGKLRKDLDLLINTSKLPSGFNKEAKVLVVNGESDAIVSDNTKFLLMEELKNHLDKDPVNWILKGEGHFIELTQLINNVMNWLESY